MTDRFSDIYLTEAGELKGDIHTFIGLLDVCVYGAKLNDDKTQILVWVRMNDDETNNNNILAYILDGLDKYIAHTQNRNDVYVKDIGLIAYE